MKKYAIQIHQGEILNDFSYLFNLDKNGKPTKIITFEAEDLEQAISLMGNIEFCNKLGIPEKLFFEQYKLRELKDES